MEKIRTICTRCGNDQVCGCITPGRLRPRRIYDVGRPMVWRNVMVAGINAGIEQGFFGVELKQNYFGYCSATYHFSIEAIPAIANVCLKSFWEDEVSFHIALYPTADAERWIRPASLFAAASRAGDVFAMGWLERREEGAFLVPTVETLCCHSYREATVAALNVEARGYFDHDHGTSVFLKRIEENVTTPERKRTYLSGLLYHR